MKKAQITLFMIIAMVLLLGAALFIYLKEKEIIFQPEIITPPEIEPIKKYIEQCVLDLSIDAIERIGLQGGYLNIPDVISKDPQSFIDQGFGLYSVPYWYHGGEMRVPDIDFIRAELAAYIEQNLQLCTDGFGPFQSQYEFREKQPKVDISFRNSDLMVLVTYPIRISDRYYHKATSLEEFTVVVPVDLQSAHALAVKIMDAQHDDFLFENLTLEIMTANSIEFPFSGMEFQCGRLDWRISQMKSRLQEIMKYNLPRVRLRNTDHPPFEREEAFYQAYARFTFMEMMEKIYDTYPDGYFPDGARFPHDITEQVSDSYEYFRMFFDVGSESPDMRVSFTYQPDWGMDMVVLPSEGDRLVSREYPGSGILKFMCMQVYHFTYNVRYPVLVRIIDPYAFMGSGFTFQFAFPVLIRDNTGVHDVFRVANFDSFRTIYDFCDAEENYGDTIYSITAKGIDEDGYTEQPINDVMISYRCMNRRCDDIGKTEFQGRLETALPEGCGGAVIYGNKEGYLEGRARVEGDEVEIGMEKLRAFEYEVKVVPYFTATGTFGDPVDLAHDEQATVYIDFLGHDYTQTLSEPNLTSRTLYLREAGGNYRIDAALHRGEAEILGGYFVKDLEIRASEYGSGDTVVIPVIAFRPEPFDKGEEAMMMSFLLDGSYNESVRPVFS